MLQSTSHSLDLLVSVNRFKGTAVVCWAGGLSVVSTAASLHIPVLKLCICLKMKVLASLMRRRLI